MSRVDVMADRLPHIYRDGELIRGSETTGGVLGIPAVQLEVLDEEARDVQRSHWFDAAPDLDDVAALAAVLDFVPEPWQTVPLFRAWVHALRDAMLQKGAVTVDALQSFVTRYTAAFQSAVRLQAVPRIQGFSSAKTSTEPSFVENPPLRRFQRAPGVGGIEPLHQFTITQKGLDETTAAFLFVGLPEAPESVPALVNATTGDALVFLGQVQPGARLWIRPLEDGLAAASLDGVDVSDRLRSVAGVVPGHSWTSSSVESPARAITLARGDNTLWFLPLAHFDELGLNRFLLSLPDLLLRLGRYDETAFDHSLFHLDAAIHLWASWVETQPARVDIELPAGALLSRENGLDASLEERDRLESSLNLAIQKLKAAAVEIQTSLAPFRDVQAQSDRLTAVLPMVHREVGPTGTDHLPDAGGVFGVTQFEDSTFR